MIQRKACTLTKKNKIVIFKSGRQKKSEVEMAGPLCGSFSAADLLKRQVQLLGYFYADNVF